MKIGIVWNGRASTAASTAPEDVRARVAEACGAEVSLQALGDGHDSHRCVDTLLVDGADVVIAAGGDGTVSSVAAELVGKRAVLGVLPLGTANSFAAALGIPPDIDGAIAVLGAGNRRALDLARVRSTDGEKVMVMHCTLGFHAQVIGETSTESKRRWGVLAYVGSALKKLAGLETFALEIAGEHHVLRCRATAVAAANIAPERAVFARAPSHLVGDDGRLEVTIIAAESVAEAVATGLHLWRYRHDQTPATRDNIGSLSIRRATVTTDPPQAVLVDGERFGTTPVELITIARALEVIAPPRTEPRERPIEAELLGLPDLEIE